MTEQTPQFLIKKEILKLALRWENIKKDDFPEDDKLEAYFDKLNSNYELGDEIQEFRWGGVNGDHETTDIKDFDEYPYEYRAFESEGIWVAFPFYYGGGKFSNVHEWGYIEDAIFVNMKEEVKTVKKFSKIE